MICSRTALPHDGYGVTPPRRSALLDGGPQFFGGRPGSAAVDHAMAVGADEGQVAEFRPAFACLMQRHHMVALDIPGAAIAVDLFEVETARLTGQASALPQNRVNLLLPQALVPFPRPVAGAEAGALRGH